MKFYPPKPSVYDPDRDGFTQHEVTTGQMFLHADVQCEDCKHVLPVAVAGSTDNGKCNRCGGRAS